MSMANPIESSTVDVSGVALTQNTNSVGKFASAMDAAAYASQLTGPMAYEMSALYAPSSADIVGAAVNATAGYSGGTGMLTTPGTYSGATSNYYGGGMSAAGTTGYSATSSSGSSTDMMAMAQEQLAASQSSSIAMLMVQDEMGQQNRLYTSASNLMNSRDTMLGSIIRNVRVG